MNSRTGFSPTFAVSFTPSIFVRPELAEEEAEDFPVDSDALLFPQAANAKHVAATHIAATACTARLRIPADLACVIPAKNIRAHVFRRMYMRSGKKLNLHTALE